MIKFRILFFILSAVFTVLIFQNCGVSSNFKSDSFLTAMDQNNNVMSGDQNVSSKESKLQMFTIKENQIVSEAKLSDSYFLKINFDKTYKNPKLCMATFGHEDDCRNHPENYTDLKNLSGRFLVEEDGVATFIQNNTSDLMRSIFPSHQKLMNFSFYFLSEYHPIPVHIGSLKVTNEQNQGSSSSVSCITTAASEWSTFNRPGLNIRGVLPGGASSAMVAYKFSIDPNIFQRGAVVKILPSSLGQYSGRVTFISECPNDFTNPPAGNTAERCTGVDGTFSRMELILSGHENFFQKHCILKPGKTYYLNMKTIKGYWGDYEESSYQLDTDVL